MHLYQKSDKAKFLPLIPLSSDIPLPNTLTLSQQLMNLPRVNFLTPSHYHSCIHLSTSTYSLGTKYARSDSLAFVSKKYLYFAALNNTTCSYLLGIEIEIDPSCPWSFNPSKLPIQVKALSLWVRLSAGRGAPPDENGPFRLHDRRSWASASLLQHHFERFGVTWCNSCPRLSLQVGCHLFIHYSRNSITCNSGRWFFMAITGVHHLHTWTNKISPIQVH